MTKDLKNVNIDELKKLNADELEAVTAGFDLDRLTPEEQHRYAELKNAFIDILKGKRQATVEEYVAAHEAVKAFTEELNAKYPDNKDPE